MDTWQDFTGQAWTQPGERVTLRQGDRVRPHGLASFSEPTTRRIVGKVGTVTETSTEEWDVLIDFDGWVGGFYAHDFVVEP